MSFKITPMDEVKEPLREKIKRKYELKKGGKELNNTELWEIGWIMWKLGSLYRFRISNTTDMKTPVGPPFKYVVNSIPKVKTTQ